MKRRISFVCFVGRLADYGMAWHGTGWDMHMHMNGLGTAARTQHNTQHIQAMHNLPFSTGEVEGGFDRRSNMGIKPERMDMVRSGEI